MRIVFVTSTLHAGGSERVMALLANALSERQHHVEIVCLNQHLVFYPLRDDVEVLFARDEAHSNFIGSKLRWMRGYIKRKQPDVVIAFMLEVYCATLCALMGLQVPVITSDRISPSFFDYYKRYMRWMLLRLCSHHVVQTQQVLSSCPKSVKKRTTIIPNPVTNEVFREMDVEKGNVIIAVGRLAPQKNYPMMFSAFATIAKEFPDWKLVVWGEGPLRSSLELLVKSLQLDGRVLLPGRTEHVIDELRKSKVFCMASNYEGMSNAMLEAVCVGLPVLTTDVSGASDMIRNGEDGFICKVGDEKGFASCLKQLISDETMMRQMGMRNRQKADRFKEEVIVDQWEQVILRVLGKKEKN